MKTTLKAEAARKLESYLASGVKGFFEQAWDRLRAAGLDVDLRCEPTEANARALLWTARN